ARSKFRPHQMIVVDSSVWIAQIRRTGAEALHKLRSIENLSGIIVGDLVLLEVLQGTRDDLHAAKIEREMRKFTVERMLDDSIAVKAASNYRMLRSRGITVRKTTDLIIATFCIER